MIANLKTPNGNPVRFDCRPDTNDRQILAHVSELDEYRLGGLELAGYAVDVGAHIGGVTIPLLIDHPDLQVLALEAVEANAQRIAIGAARNQVANRATIIPRAAADDEDGRTVTVNRDGPQRYVGNLDAEGEPVRVASITLTHALEVAGARKDGSDVALLKIDCEGCETEVLRDPACAGVALIVGEYHGHSTDWIFDALPNHDVTIAGYTFRAVRR